jgi:glucose uptake protein
MFLPSTQAASLLLLFLNLLCWGSWGNTAKWSRLPFPTFYGIFSVSLCAWTVLLGFLLGSDWYPQDEQHNSFFRSIGGASARSVGYACAGGAVFNIANVLLTVLIKMVGLAVSFPICIGIGLIAGTLLDYAVQPAGTALLPLCAGLGMALAALLSMGAAYYFKSQDEKSPGGDAPTAVVATEASAASAAATPSSLLLNPPVAPAVERPSWAKLVGLCCSAGCIMACFSPLSTLAQTPAGEPGVLNPYSCMFFFSLAVLVTSVPICFFLARMPLDGSEPLPCFYKLPKRYSAQDVWMPVLGALVWTMGTMLNFVAGAKIDYAVAYSIGQAAPMAAALWGIFWFREFEGAPAKSRIAMGAMFALYSAAIFVIASAGAGGGGAGEHVSPSPSSADRLFLR